MKSVLIMDSKIKNDTYYSVQSFMVKDMGLKDVELAIYAIIYGFSQDGESTFNGSLSYLAEWTGCTKQYVCSVLKNMVNKELLIKSEQYINGVKCCSYRCNLETIKKIVTPLRKSEYPIKEILTPPLRKSEQGIKKSLTNNIEDNINNNIEDIIMYLNQKAKKKYRTNIAKTKTLINARMKEGFTVEDFHTVIDNKCAEWLNDSKMQRFLRPETLFGTKFEGYLNSTTAIKATDKTDPNSYNDIDDSEEFLRQYG